MSRYDKGWVKLHRKAYAGDLGDNLFCFGLWAALLSIASWEESTIMWEGNQRVLPPGSVVFGTRELALKFKCNKSTIQKWLDYLVKTNRIIVETSPRGSLATICNWKEYQIIDAVQAATAPPGARSQDRQEMGTYKELRIKNNTIQAGNGIEDAASQDQNRANTGAIPAGYTECLDEYALTLERYAISKDPRADELDLLRLLKVHGYEQTRLALIGARFEPRTDKFDPAKYFSLRRIAEPKNFSRFVNLGAQQQSATQIDRDKILRDQARQEREEMLARISGS